MPGYRKVPDDAISPLMQDVVVHSHPPTGRRSTTESGHNSMIPRQVEFLAPSPAQLRRLTDGQLAILSRRKRKDDNRDPNDNGRNNQRFRAIRGHSNESLSSMGPTDVTERNYTYIPTLPSLDFGEPLIAGRRSRNSTDISDEECNKRASSRTLDKPPSGSRLSRASISDRPRGNTAEERRTHHEEGEDEDTLSRRQAPLKRAGSFKEELVDKVDGNVVRHAVALLQSVVLPSSDNQEFSDLERDLISRISIAGKILSEPQVPQEISQLLKSNNDSLVDVKDVLPRPVADMYGDTSTVLMNMPADKPLPSLPDSAKNSPKLERRHTLAEAVPVEVSLQMPKERRKSAEPRIALPISWEEHTCEQCDVLLSLNSYLRITLQHYSTALKDEQNRRRDVEVNEKRLQAELEDLTSSLFQQANTMVSDEKKRAAIAEEKVLILERIVEELQNSIRITGYLKDTAPSPASSISRTHSFSIDRRPSSGQSTSSSCMNADIHKMHKAKFHDFSAMVAELAAAPSIIDADGMSLTIKSHFFHKVLEEDVYPTLKFEGCDSQTTLALVLRIADGTLELREDGGKMQGLEHPSDSTQSIAGESITRRAESISSTTPKLRTPPTSKHSVYSRQSQQPLKLRRFWSDIRRGFSDGRPSGSPNAQSKHNEAMRAFQQTDRNGTFPHGAAAQECKKCVFCGISTSIMEEPFAIRIQSARPRSAEPSSTSTGAHSGWEGLMPNQKTSLGTAESSWSSTTERQPSIFSTRRRSTLSSRSSLASRCKLLDQPDVWFPIDAACCGRVTACIRYFTWLHAVRLRFWKPVDPSTRMPSLLRHRDLDLEWKLFRECQGHRLEMAMARLGETILPFASDYTTREGSPKTFDGSPRTPDEGASQGVIGQSMNSSIASQPKSTPKVNLAEASHTGDTEVTYLQQSRECSRNPTPTPSIKEEGSVDDSDGDLSTGENT